jgi:3-polyprenyl-4-hydroxybenzoate decarboxylase
MKIEKEVEVTQINSDLNLYLSNKKQVAVYVHASSALKEGDPIVSCSIETLSEIPLAIGQKLKVTIETL